MSKLSLKGIFFGGLTDIVLSTVLGIPLSVYIVLSRGLSSLPREQVQAATIAALHESIALRSIQLLIGFGCSVLGGYVAARLAKHDELLNGVLASWLCIGIGAYSIARGISSEPLPLHVLFIGMTPLCYLLGAYVMKQVEGASPLKET